MRNTLVDTENILEQKNRPFLYTVKQPESGTGTLKTGKEQAFQKLMHLYGKGIFNLCIGMIPNRENAENITRDVFVEAYQYMDSSGQGEQVKTWLSRIALNKCYNHIKYSKRQKKYGIIQSLFYTNANPLEVPHNFAHPGIALENKEHAKVLYGALAVLPETQKAAFTLHEMQGMDYKQIADTMKLSVPAVESLLSRARTGLRKKLRVYFTL